MAVQQAGKDNATILDVDAGHDAGRVSLRPSAVLGWSTVVGRTGVLAATLAAGGLLWVMRNTGSNLLLVRRLQLSFQLVTAFTTAQRVEFSLTRAKNWTAAFESQGNALAFNMGQHRTTLATLNAEGRVASTAAIAPSTRTVDTGAIGFATAGVGALGSGIPIQNLISHDAGDYPVALAQGEGLLLTNDVLWGAGGTGVATVVAEIAEMTLAKWGT